MRCHFTVAIIASWRRSLAGRGDMFGGIMSGQILFKRRRDLKTAPRPSPRAGQKPFASRHDHPPTSVRPSRDRRALRARCRLTLSDPVLRPVTTAASASERSSRQDAGPPRAAVAAALRSCRGDRAALRPSSVDRFRPRPDGFRTPIAHGAHGLRACQSAAGDSQHGVRRSCAATV